MKKDMDFIFIGKIASSFGKFQKTLWIFKKCSLTLVMIMIDITKKRLAIGQTTFFTGKIAFSRQLVFSNFSGVKEIILYFPQ